MMSSIGETIMGSMFRVWIYMIMIIFVICTFLYTFHTNQSVHFEQMCNEVVERQGGMTKTAYDKCNDISKRAYGNAYHVSVDPDVSHAQDTNDGLTNNANDNYSAQKEDGMPVTYYIYATTSEAGINKARAFSNAGKPMVSTVQSDVRRGSLIK